MSRALVFAGPSLPRGVALPDGIELRPPAGLGDILRATLEQPRPRLIGLVDGVFEGEPPVRHKEILFALSQGVRVLGAASMGALRAAELRLCGMEAVGVVAWAFCDGVLLGEPFGDDDEVAVVHGPAALGYPLASDAMVDIRLSLAAATEAGVLDRSAASGLLALAKARFFKERTYETLLADALRLGHDPQALDRLAAWLPGNRVEQKRADTLALLAAASAEAAAVPTAPAFRFETTTAWLDLVDTVAGGEDALADAEIEEEMLLRPGLAPDMLAAALFDHLREREAGRRGWPRADAASMADRFRPTLARRLPDVLRRLGIWPEIEAAILAKRALSRSSGIPAPDRLHVTPASLVAWHRGRCGRTGAATVEAWAAELGFADPERMIAALDREFSYRRNEIE